MLPLFVFRWGASRTCIAGTSRRFSRFALSITGDKETAEDITSEAFVALYKNLASIDESLLPGWLLTVARNRARDM
jgi:DNA-directed RNA polymerase specialized sigma24 family protein